MNGSREVRITPIVSWPSQVMQGGTYLITVDMSVEEEWPYTEEEFEVTCVLDGLPGVTVEAIGGTTVVVHRFGGSYGAARFLLHVGRHSSNEKSTALRLTLFNARGVRFHSVRLPMTLMSIGEGVEPEPVSAGNMPRRLQRPQRYSIEPLTVSTAELPTEAPPCPSRLLTATNGFVPFVMRHEEFAHLAAWAESPAGGIQLLHGPGGQGKTRLAKEFALRLLAEDWKVYVVRPRPPTYDEAEPAPEPDRRGKVLLLVDYAEGWPADALLELADDHGLREGDARALFLARTADAWWEVVSGELSQREIAVTSLKLPPLTSSAHRRWEIYLAAVETFATIYGIDSAHMRLLREESFEPPDFDQVLMIHMAALVTVHTGGRLDEPSLPTEHLDPARLTEVLLELERSMLAHPSRAFPAELPERLLFSSALVGPLPSEQAAEVLTCMRVSSATPASELLGFHSRHYPSGEPGTALQPITPDRLSEDLIALMLDQGDTGWDAPAPGSPPWATQAVLRLLETIPGQARQVIGILTETAHRWPHVADWLVGTLRERPHWAVEAGGAVLTNLLNLRDVDAELLRGLERALPEEANIDLDLAAVIVTERLLEQVGLSRLEAAGLHDRLGQRLSYMGLYGEALETAKRAVELVRELSDDNPASHKAFLAKALGNLSNRLGELGWRDEGMALSIEALQAHRLLAENDPYRYELPLALTLNNLGVRAAELGDRDNAHQHVYEAVEIFRRLAAADPLHLPHLAQGLSNLSVQLDEMGDARHALEASSEAVVLYRGLADARPDVHRADLARALCNHANRLVRVGRFLEAVETAREADLMLRPLSEERAEAFLPLRASNLANLANHLHAVGYFAESFSAISEAVTIHRELAERQPLVFLPQLASSLNNLSVVFRALGLNDDSVTVMSEAVDLFRQLARDRPEAFLPEFGVSLNNLANRLRDRGDVAAALEVLTEAIAIRRKLAERRPLAFLSDLAVSLHNQAALLAEIGHDMEALGPLDEAAEIRRSLAERDSGTYGDLVDTLGLYLDVLPRLRRMEQLNEVISEIGDTVSRWDPPDPDGGSSAEHRTRVGVYDWLQQNSFDT